ncbi:MAG: DUF4296 domain-containing protein [Muribaculaceae bacterium]
MYKSLIIFAFLLFLVSCGGTPSYVIDKDDMVLLLVDVHKGEAVTEIDGAHYYNDSLKKMLKQSIFIKHGVTQEQFDTSLVWYGHNIDKFIEVYDEAIIKLQEEDRYIVAQARAAGNGTPLATGDSVNLWTKESIRLFRQNLGNGEVTFNLLTDNNFKKGDRFQWAFLLLNNQSSVNVFLAVDYKDGSTSYTTTSSDFEGWNRFSLQTDSARVPRRVYGYVDYKAPKKSEIVYLDSISLVRTRLDNANYSSIYSQKALEKNKKAQ